MSIWDFEFAADPDWPDWFREHWQAERDRIWARVTAAANTQERRERSSAELMAQIEEDLERDKRWRASLSSDQRAWIAGKEAWDRACATRHVSPDEWKEVVEPRIARAKALGLTDSDPVRAFVLAANTRTPDQEVTFSARLARVIARAIEVLGSHDAATSWLRRPSRALDDRVPIGHLETAAGEQRVIEALDLLELGWYPTDPPRST